MILKTALEIAIDILKDLDVEAHGLAHRLQAAIESGTVSEELLEQLVVALRRQGETAARVLKIVEAEVYIARQEAKHGGTE
jgi:hypothetical protein